jgi:hypothetical protein
MEIDKIAKQILSEKPKPKFSICLNLDINSSINEQFEIISLIFFRGINDLIINEEYNEIKDVKKIKNFLLKKILLLKIYFGSFGVNLKSENVLKKDYNKFKMIDRPSYYTENKYNFNFVILKNHIHKGKLRVFYYNHTKKENNIENMYIIIKFRNHFFKFSFNLLKK